MLLLKNLPTFQSVALGGSATCDLRLGDKVWMQILRISDNGTASADILTGRTGGANLTQDQLEGIMDRIIREIRVEINSKPQRRAKASQINQINRLNGTRYQAFYSGTPGTPGFTIFLTIFWAEFWRKDLDQVPALALNLNPNSGTDVTTKLAFAGVDSAQIKVELNDSVVVPADAGNGITGGPASVAAPDISGFYAYTPYDSGHGVGAINKWITTDLAALGTKNDFKLDRVQFIQAIHLWPTQENAPKTVTYFRLEASGNDVHDRLSADDIAGYQYMMELDPATNGRVDVVFDADDVVTNALLAQTQTSLTMYLEYSGSAAGNLPVLIERIGELD